MNLEGSVRNGPAIFRESRICTLADEITRTVLSIDHFVLRRVVHSGHGMYTSLEGRRLPPKAFR